MPAAMKIPFVSCNPRSMLRPVNKASTEQIISQRKLMAETHEEASGHHHEKLYQNNRASLHLNYE